MVFGKNMLSSLIALGGHLVLNTLKTMVFGKNMLSSLIALAGHLVVNTLKTIAFWGIKFTYSTY
jgi:hypothetical protein